MKDPGHRPRTAHVILLSLIVLGMTPRAAAAAPPTPGAPVELTIKPHVVLVGQPVVVSGVTGYHAKAKQLKIQIKNESGKPTAALSTEVQPQGTFSTTFKDTKQVGRYTVEVTGPDGKNTAKGEFRVVSLAGLADELESAFGAIDKRQRALVKLAHDKIASLPPTPERDLLIDVIIKLTKSMNDVTLPPVVIIGTLRKLPKVIDLPEVKIIGELENAIDEMKDASGKGTDLLNRTDATECETINTAIEGAKLAGALFNIPAKALEAVRHVFIDKSISSLVEHAFEGDHAAAFALTAELKVAAEAVQKEEGKIIGLKGGLVKSWTSIAFDFVELGTKHVFAAYCVRISSPLRVKMRMVWKESGTPWYKYGVRLEGRLDLRYSKKNPPGQPIKITGELEGSATNFAIWEDVLAVQQFPKGMVILARRWLAPLPPPPLATDLNEAVDFGEVLRGLATPYSFNVPVEGTVKGDEIELQFKPARIDFSEAVRGVLLFVGLPSTALPVPEWSVFNFPIEKAQWIVRRGFGEPGKIKLQKGKDEEGKDIRFVVDALDTHRDSPDKSINVDWQIRFDSRLKTVKQLPDPTFPF